MALVCIRSCMFWQLFTFHITDDGSISCLSSIPKVASKFRRLVQLCRLYDGALLAVFSGVSPRLLRRDCTVRKLQYV